jgi:hypothetical protein
MLITFFDINGTVHCEFITQGQTVNQAYYVEILKQLHEAVHRKRPELSYIDWILHHDNAPAQAISGLKNHLLKWNTTQPIPLIWI